MLEDAADVMQRHLAQAGVFLAGKQRLAAFPQALVGVHPAAVVAEDRLRHERHGLAVAPRHVLDDVLVQQLVVAHLHHRVEPQIDLCLAGRGHLVMGALDVQADLFHHQDHLAPDIDMRIAGRDGEIPFLVTQLVAEVRELLAAAVPDALDAVDEIIPRVRVLIVTHVVEDKELRFRPKIRRVGNLGLFQVRLGLAGDIARVAAVRFARDRVDRVGHDANGAGLGKRIDKGADRVQHQEHVAGLDRFPAADR